MARRIDPSDPNTAFWEADTLDDHLELVRRQVQRSLADPETRKLAHGLFTGDSKVQAWGRLWKCAPCTNVRDDCAIINAVWNFCVLNVRYEHDPPDYDLFCTVRKTLEAKVGDCDDSTIVLCSLLKALGWQDTRGRVITTDNTRWTHIYAVVSKNRNGSGGLIALDPTVKGATPGWEYAGSKQHRDFIF